MMNENNNNENNNIANEEQLAALKKKKGPIIVIINVILLLLVCVCLYYIVRFSYAIVEILLKKEEWFAMPFFSPLFLIPILIFAIIFLVGWIIVFFRFRKNMIKKLLTVNSKEEASTNQTGGYKMTAKDILIIVIILFIYSIIVAFVHK